MKILIRFCRSSIGRKYLMAITGLLLFAFVVAHMLGNLKIFSGPDSLNHYAKMLKTYPALLWSFRIGLFTAAIIHVVIGISLVLENQQARPVDYARQRTIQASLASITMGISGMIVLAFIIYHILHFTVMAFHPEYHEMKAPIAATPGIYQAISPVQEGTMYPDVYGMVISAFSNRWISGFYIISVGILAFHLSHGLSSMFQSLGLRTRSMSKCLPWLARIVALIIFLGMAVVPFSVLFGLVK